MTNAESTTDRSYSVHRGDGGLPVRWNLTRADAEAIRQELGEKYFIHHSNVRGIARLHRGN